jgi:Lon protease-like protein
MSLRIFEPRYVRLVKNACATDSGFGICMLNAQGNEDKNEHIYAIGTYVKVVDFDLLDDGLLGVTVEGVRCFSIDSIITEQDGLRVGQCQWLDNWSAESAQVSISPIDERLKEIFDKYPELPILYQQPKFNDPIWVIYRWLELIPVKAEQKQQFLQQKNCEEALDFLTKLVE